MPRRESCSPVPRRSPRAAVKASASPSPIIRASRSRSTASKETTTPKTRVASPSPKRRAPAKSAKAEKEETPKQSGRASTSKKAADEKKNKSPATPKTPAVSSKSRSRGKQKNVEEEETPEESKPSERRSRSRTQVTKAAAKTPEVEKETVASSRRSRAQPKEESEEEEEPKSAKSDKKKPPPKQQESEQSDDGSAASHTASRSRRAASRQSEEPKVEKEAVKEQIASRPMRSRSRVQVKKAEEESCAELAEEGRASRGRRSEPSETAKKDSPETKDAKSKKIAPKKGRAQSKAVTETKDTEPSEIEEDETTKIRKRHNAEVDKSPEITTSSRKRRRKVDDDAANEAAISEPVSRSKKQTGKTGDEDSDEETTEVHNVEIPESDKSRTETDMDVDEEMSKTSPVKQTPGSSPKKESLQSKTTVKDALSMKVGTVESKIQAESVGISEPSKSSDKDLSEDTIKKVDKDKQLPKSHDNLSKNVPSCTDASKITTKSSDLELQKTKSPVESPSAVEVSKSPVKSPSAVVVSKSPAKPVAAAPVSTKPVTVAPVSTIPAKPVAAAPVSTKPVAAAPVSTIPAKPVSATPDSPKPVSATPVSTIPVAAVVMSKSPAESSLDIKLSKSPIKISSPSDMAKNITKSPVTMNVSQNLVKSPMSGGAAKSPAKSPVAMDVAKSPAKSPVAMDVAKSPAKSPVDLTKSFTPLSGIQKSSVKSTSGESSTISVPALHLVSSSPAVTLPQKDGQVKNVTGSHSSNINAMSASSHPLVSSHNQTATSPSKSVEKKDSMLSTQIGEGKSITPCINMPTSKSESTLSPGKSQISQVPSMLSSKPTSTSEIGILSSKQSSLKIASQSQKPLVQNPTQPLASTISSSAQSPGTLQKHQPLTQSAKQSSSEKSVTSTNVLSTQQPVKSDASSTTIQSSSVKSSLVPNPQQSPVKSSITSLNLGKPSASPEALQKKLDHSGPASQSDKPKFASTEQTSHIKSSVNITSSSLQVKTPGVQSSSISPSKPAAVSEKLNPTSSTSPKPPTSISCTSPNKPTVTSVSGTASTKPSIVSEPPKQVSPSIVSVGQSGGLSSLSSKTQSSAISNLKPQVTHVAAGASNKPLITHMTGVVPQKPSTIHPPVMPTKTSSLSPNKSQAFSSFSTSPPKPPSSVISKPAIMQQSQHESSGTSVKPQQTLGTTASPAKPQITHMAGIAVHSRPQVTHMSGIAPKSGATSDISSHPKPPVVHVTGSAVPKAPGTISSSVATSSPPKSSNSSSSHSATSVSSTADGSPSSSQPPLKSPLVPVTSVGTEKPIVSPSLSSSTKSGQHQTLPDSSLGRSSSISQITSSAPANMSVQSSHTQSSTKSVENKSASMPDTLTKTTQPSSTTGQQLVDTKAQPSLTSRAPDSSVTSSAKSLSTPVSNSVRENQSKVPTPKLQPSIPGISSTATAVASKPVSSSSSTSSSTPLQSQIKPAPVSVTVGNVQGPGTIPIASGASPQLAAASKTSSSSDGVINGSSTKTSASTPLQSSETTKKRKLDSEEPEENPESKKARVSAEDSKSLVANGQKVSGQSANKPEVMDVDPSPSMKQDSNGNEVSLKDYVVVNKNEVPHKDSPEVKQSLPKTSLPNPTPTPLSSGVSSSPSITTCTSSSSSSSSSSTAGSSIQTIDHKDILLNRAFKLNPALFSSTITEKSKQFSVVTYNILADCHFRTNDKMDRYPADEKPFIQLPARHRRLMAELRYVDADIVCLQEVEPEYYSKTLSPDMQKLGYEGFYKKRVHENFDEGETTFYKTSRFSDPENTAYSLKQLIDKDIQELSLSEDVKESVRKFMCRPDVVLVTRLRCKNTGKFITVGNVHVNWGQFKLPNLQCVQIARAIREVVNRAGNDTSPHVICGDFNSFPTTPGYQLASEGYLSHSMIQFLQSSKTMEMPDGTKSALIDHLWEGFQHTSSSLKSAYAVVQGREPDLTTRTTNTQECLDYVFYSSTSLEAVGVLQVPHKQTVLNCKFIPNRIFPSDHLSLKAVLAFK